MRKLAWENESQRPRGSRCLSPDQNSGQGPLVHGLSFHSSGRNMGLGVDGAGAACERKTEALQSCFTSFNRERGMEAPFMGMRKCECRCTVPGATVFILGAFFQRWMKKLSLPGDRVLFSIQTIHSRSSRHIPKFWNQGCRRSAAKQNSPEKNGNTWFQNYCLLLCESELTQDLLLWKAMMIYFLSICIFSQLNSTYSLLSNYISRK